MIELELAQLLLRKNDEPSSEDLQEFYTEYSNNLTDLLTEQLEIQSDNHPELSEFLEMVDAILERSEQAGTTDEQIAENYQKINQIITLATNSSEEISKLFSKMIQDFDNQIISDLRSKLSEEDDVLVEQYLIDRLEEVEEMALSLTDFWSQELEKIDSVTTTDISTTQNQGQIFTSL